MFLPNLHVTLLLSVLLPGQPDWQKEYYDLTQQACISGVKLQFKLNSERYDNVKVIGICKPQNPLNIRELTVTCVKGISEPNNGCEVK